MPLTHRLVLILVVLMAGALTLTTSATTWLLERQLLQRADQEEERAALARDMLEGIGGDIGLGLGRTYGNGNGARH